MKPHQLVLDLPQRKAQGKEDYFVTPANELALRKIENWPNWAGGKLALIGPKGAGKSHLAAVWAELTQAKIIKANDAERLPKDWEGPLVIEDVERIAKNAPAQEAVFHIHNRVIGAGHPLLLTGNATPHNWNLTLPDLRSRMEAADICQLGPPDDALLMAVVVKLFEDRQLQVDPKVITFLVSRMDRSIADAQSLIARLDAAALSAKRKITVPLAATVIKSKP